MCVFDSGKNRPFEWPSHYCPRRAQKNDSFFLSFSMAYFAPSNQAVHLSIFSTASQSYMLFTSKRINSRSVLFLFAFIPGKRTFTTEIIATVTKAGKTPNAEGNDFFEMVPVLIPSLTPTMKSSRCIKISYQIKVIPYWRKMSCGKLWNQICLK